MEINEFICLMRKLARFKGKLANEGITGEQADIVLKIYLESLTEKIDTKILERVV